MNNKVMRAIEGLAKSILCDQDVEQIHRACEALIDACQDERRRACQGQPTYVIKPLYTIQELADMMGCHRTTATYRLRAWGVPMTRIGRRYSISLDSLLTAHPDLAMSFRASRDLSGEG